MKKKKEKKPKQKFKILVVDDEPEVLKFFTRLFKDTAFISVAATGEDAVTLTEKEKYDLAFIDVMLPGIDGVEVLKKLKKINPDTIAVMMSGHEIDDHVKSAVKNGAVEFLPKPFRDADQILTIKEAAKLLKVNHLTLYKLAKNNEFPATRLGSQWRVHRERLEQWVKGEKITHKP